MAVEVLWNHMDAVAETGIKLGERHNVLIPGEWLLWARRVTGWDDLLVYRHRVRGSFVLMDLVFPGSGIGRELKVLPAAPDQGGWIGKYWLMRHAKPLEVSIEELSHKWQAEARNRQSGREEQREALQDTQSWLKRKNRDAEAAALHLQPYHMPEDSSMETALNRAAAR